MAPSANALPPALVDLALGPEVANATANEAEADNAADTASPYRPLNVTDTAPAPSTAEEEPADDVPDPAIEDTNSAEE